MPNARKTKLPQRAAGPDKEGLTPLRRKEKKASRKAPLLEKRGQTRGKENGTEQHHP